MIRLSNLVVETVNNWEVVEIEVSHLTTVDD